MLKLTIPALRLALATNEVARPAPAGAGAVPVARLLRGPPRVLNAGPSVVALIWC